MGFGVDPAMAEEPGGPLIADRKIVLARAPAGHPATVYGAADRPLLLLFDTPLGKGAIRAPGVEVRRLPSNPYAVALVPPRALVATRGSVPVVIPLVGGPVSLTLAFRPEAPDRRVRILRSLEWARPRAPGAPGTLVSLAAAGASMGHAPAPPLIELVISDSAETTVPDAAMKCRLGFIIRTAGDSKGHAVELRSADRALCDAHLP